MPQVAHPSPLPHGGMNLATIVRNGFALVTVAAAIGLMVLAAGCGQSTPQGGGQEKPLLAGKPVELPAPEPEQPSADTGAGKPAPAIPAPLPPSATDTRPPASPIRPAVTKWRPPRCRRPRCCRQGLWGLGLLGLGLRGLCNSGLGPRGPIRHRWPTRCVREAAGGTRVGRRCKPSRRRPQPGGPPASRACSRHRECFVHGHRFGASRGARRP